jgi:hypothetical protein
LKNARFPLSPRLSAHLLPAVALSLALAGCTADTAREAVAAKSPRNAATAASAPAYALATTAGRTAAAFASTSGSDRTDSTTTESALPKIRYNAGENPEFARQCGWPVPCPPPLPGSILPGKRIVAYYGNPLSKRMGVLGEIPKDEMLYRLKGEVTRWQAADPATPVQPALHLIAVVAQGKPGKAGKYRMIVTDEVVNRVYGWAREANTLLFIDIQTGHEDIRTLLPRFEWLLKNPDVHLGIDPEFNLIKSGRKPGTIIGTYDGADVNYVSGYLADLVKKYRLPPKVLIVHRFTRNGVTNAKEIVLRPEVQIVMNMDGWGAPWLKRDSYEDYVVAEPVQYTGFKLFYHNDTKKGVPLMTPRDLLKLRPQPLYVQYQ